MIPRTLHQVWVGPLPLPEDFARFGESWRRHHPGWEMRFWTEENLPTDLVRKEAYERLRKPAERSDIIRLEVLFRFGGVYVDTDIECLRPIDPLLEGVDFFTGRMEAGRVSNAFIGSVPGHPLLERALRELRPVTEYGLDENGTGQGFLSTLLRDYPDATTYPPEYFYGGQSAYAINHHALSWMSREKWMAANHLTEHRFKEERARVRYLEALLGLRGPSAGVRAWRAAITAWARRRFGHPVTEGDGRELVR